MACLEALLIALSLSAPFNVKRSGKAPKSRRHPSSVNTGRMLLPPLANEPCWQTFRLHSKRFYEKPDSCCDLLICDEAHRLKNSETATNQALAGLKCRRRILLSGTPMQNDLDEFYAMTDFTNPGVSAMKRPRRTARGEMVVEYVSKAREMLTILIG